MEFITLKHPAQSTNLDSISHRLTLSEIKMGIYPKNVKGVKVRMTKKYLYSCMSMSNVVFVINESGTEVDGGRRIKSEKQYVCYKGKWIESDKLSIPRG